MNRQTGITVEGKYDHAAIMSNAHINAKNLIQNNPWMTYKQAFAKSLKDEYLYARVLKSSYVVVNGQVMQKVTEAAWQSMRAGN
jgi:hypothetical protein